MSNSSKLYRSMSAAKAQKILDAYGGEPDNWPTQYRDALLQAINDSDTARAAQQVALRLDHQLAQQRDRENDHASDSHTIALADKIMRELPPQVPAGPAASHANSRANIRWPQLRHWWPAPVAIIAGLVAVVITLLPNDQVLPNNAELAFEQWAWEDVTAQSLLPENGTEFGVDADEDLDLLIGLRQDG